MSRIALISLMIERVSINKNGQCWPWVNALGSWQTGMIGHLHRRSDRIAKGAKQTVAPFAVQANCRRVGFSNNLAPSLIFLYSRAAVSRVARSKASRIRDGASDSMPRTGGSAPPSNRFPKWRFSAAGSATNQLSIHATIRWQWLSSLGAGFSHWSPSRFLRCSHGDVPIITGSSASTKRILKTSGSFRKASINASNASRRPPHGMVRQWIFFDRAISIAGFRNADIPVRNIVKVCDVLPPPSM